MRQRSFRLFVLLCFLLLQGIGAQGQYKRPKPAINSVTPPSNADLAVYNGVSESITVVFMNATPYDIEFQNWSITSSNETYMRSDIDPVDPHSTFMFVPVGIPRLIPGLPAQDFVPKYITKTDANGNPIFDANGHPVQILNPDWVPNWVDTTSHPYPMVFAFQDQTHGEVSTDPSNVNNWVKFTVKGVQYVPCYDLIGLNCADHTVGQDVQVGLWMYRNGTTVKQTAYWLPELKAALHAVFTTVALISTGGTVVPLWVNEILAMDKLGTTTATTWSASPENTRADDGRKMWVASYVIPNPNSLCVLYFKGCDPSTLIASGDAVYSLWPATFAGPVVTMPDGDHGPYSAAEANLAVYVGVLRGFAAKKCTAPGDDCSLGREPVVTVTVVRREDLVVGAMAGLAPNPSLGEAAPKDTIRLFLLQAGAGRIRELLEKQGRPGLLVLRSIIESLSRAQQQVLYEMVRTMGTGRLPTQQERLVVHLMADELKARLLHPQSK